MPMSYTSNPNLPQVRRTAVRLVRSGMSSRAVARHLGFNQSTIVRWVAQAPEDGRSSILTLSSRPHSHPRTLDPKVVAAILEERRRCRRCAEVVHHNLGQQGVIVSLSSVKRTLKRHGLTKSRTKWKTRRPFVERPLALAPGDLVQTDTIHFVHALEPARYYVYTAIDVCSRYAWASFTPKISQRHSNQFLYAAQDNSKMLLRTIQADNGPEFGKWLGDQLRARGVTLRHSRVRKPNDNAHIERFNRTLQDECLGRHPRPQFIPEMLEEYLPYYNNERAHLSLECATPAEVMRRS